MADGGPPPTHVRFAEDEEYVRVPQRQVRYGSREYDGRGPSRRGTGDSIPAYTRVEVLRRDDREPVFRERPYPAAGVPTTPELRSRRYNELEDVRDGRRSREGYSRWRPETIRLTQSPPPIEDDGDGRPNPRRRRSSDNSEDDRVHRVSYMRSRASRHVQSGATSDDEEDIGFHPGTVYPESSYHQSYRPPSVASDDWDPYDKFDFSLPLQSLTDASRDGESDEEAPDAEESAPRKEETVTGQAKATRAKVVHASRYTGNAELGGTHQAILTALHDAKGERSSLFRWLHVQQEVLNFDDFWHEVSRLSGLTDAEKAALARLRADVKRSCVKSRYNPKGTKVGYLEPRSVEVPLKSKQRESPTSEKARWTCIPLFSLEQYSGLLAASSLASFPPQTLLQAQYSRNTPQRDMDQAVCQLGTAKRGECFHISQLWCVVVDNSLLVTCGTMSQSDLQRETIRVNDEPSRDAKLDSNQGTIIVSYGDSVVWSFQAEECQTWFAFISKFQIFWPQVLEFRHKDQVVSAKDWPRLLRLAARPRASVRITVKTVPRPDPPPRAVLLGVTETEASTQAGKKGTVKVVQDDFHVLTLVTGGAKSDNTDALKSQLQAAERFLSTETAFSNRKAYKSSKDSTRSETYNYLAQLTSKVEENGQDAVRHAYEERIDIFNAADLLYRLFLPKEFADPTSGKFWGAIKELVTLRELEAAYIRNPYDNPLGEIRTTLREFTQEVQAFQNIMSHADIEERAQVEMPKEFANAWLYLVMAVIYSASNAGPWRSPLLRATSLMSGGMHTIIRGISDVNLLEKATVLPLEVLSLLTLDLLQDQVGKSDDICETYSQYLNSLEMAIATKPSDRSYQYRIDLVQQEITAIKRTLGVQRRIVTNIRNSLTATETSGVLVQNLEEAAVRRSRERKLLALRDHNAPRPHEPEYGHRSEPYGYGRDQPRTPYEAVTVRAANDSLEFDEEFVHDLATASKLSPTDAGGLRGLFFMECSRYIEQREFEFLRYSEYASDLERIISYKMEFTKDRQENAIFAFTLVTIIFLPLSAISSIFGMNTTDVRDMESSQWLYWAVALPVTVAVIIGGLWGMGELGNLARWLARKPNHNMGGYGAAAVVTPQVAQQTYLSPTGPPIPVDVGMDIGGDHRPPAYGTAYHHRPQGRYGPALARPGRARSVSAGRWRGVQRR